MPKTYIAKALTALSKHRPKGPELCDKVAQRLSAMTSGSVRRINSALDFGWLKWAMFNVQAPRNGWALEELPDLRRAAQLVASVFELPNHLKRQAESWDGIELGNVISACKTVEDFNARGYFLKGSFWGFSNHSEREWTQQAWIEAGWLVKAGIEALGTAAADPHNTTGASELLLRYFGRPNLAAVMKTLLTIRNGMRHNTVGIAYEGSGVGANCTYQEYGKQANHADSVRQNLNLDECGWASPGQVHNTIGFNHAFFIPSETAIRRRTLHDHNRRGNHNETTRGGAILHELSHRYANTHDVDVPQRTFEYLHRPFARAKGYNPLTCWAIAQSAPELAVNNADSYRIFCEDAAVGWNF